ncbi:TPA: hypothetical protein N0F65_005244 [Lagenidium giganteum]|uniref:Helitron helicase-like domain-containing protein n=1 Tax=Lagenidium giganteum TaxID=4803 RepID=A0AAV2YY28_9STRA|nr:TPA: hypothetical protein N0F65_005244 [Lagenidium giganteum]
MQQRYQTLVRTYGKPDLFITFTCKPQWKEIQDDLLFDQSASDRPDVVRREFIKQLMKAGVLGRTVAHFQVIEFQKRGLHHAHIFIIFEHESKPYTVDHYD